MMTQTIQTLIQICLFRGKPQDLPAYQQILYGCILAAWILSVVRINHVTDGANPLIIAVTQVALLGLGLKFLLLLFSKSERWLQSATGLFGCSALLQLVATPFLLTEDFSSLSDFEMPLAKMILVGVNLWYFAIIVYILRETLEIRVFLALLIAFSLELLFAAVLLRLFGEQAL